MKIIVRTVISVLFVIGLVTGFTSTPAGAKTSQPSASGTYRFVLEDGFSKTVEFNATSDERGGATGQMTFRDEARVIVQDVDGEGGQEECSSEFYIPAV